MGIEILIDGKRDYLSNPVSVQRLKAIFFEVLGLWDELQGKPMTVEMETERKRGMVE